MEYSQPFLCFPDSDRSPAGKACGDCNDANAAVHPGASDATCNGVDENCSGTADEGYLPVPTSCGVGACAATGATSCVGGAVRDSCTPGSPIPEICDNGFDDDCDAATDLADPDRGLPNCPDTDGDGYAACDATCSVPAGKACGDCNDGSADIHPGGAELCNGLNDDCSGGADDRQCAAFDADGDGLVDGVELSRVGREVLRRRQIHVFLHRRSAGGLPPAAEDARQGARGAHRDAAGRHPQPGQDVRGSRPLRPGAVLLVLHREVRAGVDPHGQGAEPVAQPHKISGQCGRLMCCLVYEYETYMELKKALPKVGSIVKTPGGLGKAIRHNAIGSRLTVRLEDGAEIETPIDRIQPQR